MFATREAISGRYLFGQGIEIGALHMPLPTPLGASVAYVDRLDVAGLRKHYPELADCELKCDRVDDGEKLTTFADESLDFIIANHMLEHCENPIGTVRNHFQRLRSGGFLYYAIPSREHGFDSKRPLTTWDHLLQDDQLGAEASRAEHYLEYATFCDPMPSQEQCVTYARHLMAHSYSIHFHVWNEETFRAFLNKLQLHMSRAFTIADFTVSGTEVIAVLRKV